MTDFDYLQIYFDKLYSKMIHDMIENNTYKLDDEHLMESFFKKHPFFDKKINNSMKIIYNHTSKRKKSETKKIIKKYNNNNQICYL